MSADWAASVMPSYLGAWFFCLAAPIGALPAVAGAEAMGVCQEAAIFKLRPVLWLAPVLGLLGLPVLLGLPALYPWAVRMPAGFAGHWFSPLWFSVRLVAYVAVWGGLGVVFARHPARARPGLAWLVLGVHMVIGSLAAFDWILSMTSGFGAAGFGLVVISGQMAIALALCVLLAPWRAGVLAPWLFMALITCGTLQFIQYLIIWSADLPQEISWYVRRDDTLSWAAAWLFAVAAVLAGMMMGVEPARPRPWAMRACAAFILVAMLLETLWLITPSLRGSFTLTWLDGALLAVFLGGVGLGVLRLARGAARHAHG